jgi:hypothetical protein
VLDPDISVIVNSDGGNSGNGNNNFGLLTGNVITRTPSPLSISSLSAHSLAHTTFIRDNFGRSCGVGNTGEWRLLRNHTRASVTNEPQHSTRQTAAKNSKSAVTDGKEFCRFKLIRKSTKLIIFNCALLVPFKVGPRTTDHGPIF